MITGDVIPWPYTLRESARARYTRIRLKPGEPIEVVYPRGTDQSQALHFLKTKLTWVAQQSSYLDSLRSASSACFPSRIYLPSIDRSWDVSINPSGADRVSCREMGSLLMLSGPIACVDDVRGVLRGWLKTVAKQYLDPLFHELSASSGLRFSKLTWRFQRTRWGSCSQQASISLNVRLLLLPEDQVRYVMLHELCHTRHMNHGATFWQLLKSLCPEAKRLHKQLHSRYISDVNWL